MRVWMADLARHNGSVTELPKRTVARTARLASIPLGYAGRATLGLGRRIGGAPADAVASQVQERTATRKLEPRIDEQQLRAARLLVVTAAQKSDSIRQHRLLVWWQNRSRFEARFEIGE